MEQILPLVWFFLLAGSIGLFIILDGANLGLGILSLLEQEDRKPRLIEAVGPLWYASETWLVIAGAILFGAFPVAYSLILSSLYIPVIMLIFGLIFRAVSTELRGHARQKRFWNWAFGSGCLLAALGQGFLLGALLSNPEAIRSHGTGGWSWLNPISVLVAIGLAAGWAMIGASRLSKSREVDITPRVWRLLRYSTGLVLLVFWLVILLLPLAPSADARMWLQGNRLVMVPVFGAVTAFCLAAVWLRSRHETGGGGLYAWSVAVFVGTGSSVVAALYPYIIPFSLPIREAASSTNTLFFMLFGVGILLPVIIIYNLYVARVFSKEGPKSDR
jgi:cytochrome d ubiquinol oxidase subunit II